ncbi:MAG TPA: acetylxylan esterase [Steroidobacteraceae bacterium]
MNASGKRCAGVVALCLGAMCVAAWGQASAPVAAHRLLVKRDRDSGIYGIGETVGWSITRAAGAPARGYSYVIKENALKVIGNGELHFTANVARIEVKGTRPEMLYAEIAMPNKGEAPMLLGAAVAPELLRPSVPEPADFDRFWSAKLQLLAAVPVDPVLTAAPSGRAGVEYATIVMRTIDGAHIHGQIARPVGAGRHPALLILQYAGGPYPLQRQWVTDRAAEGWLALNVEPHDVLPDQPQSYYDALPAELKSYQTIGREDRNHNYFLRMYLSDYRAVEYLAHRPDWDGHTLVVMGTSMGGQQSLCTAALNHRITAVIVNEPSGADANGEAHGRLTGYPNWPADNARALRTAPYFDTVNCAARIRAPTLVAMGFTDTTAPPAGIWTAFNRITAPKEAVPMVDSPHNNFATAEQQRPYTERSQQWLAALRRGAGPPIRAPNGPASN